MCQQVREMSEVSRIIRMKMQKHNINYPETQKCVDILVTKQTN
jgi:hypothetical protein